MRELGAVLTSAVILGWAGLQGVTLVVCGLSGIVYYILSHCGEFL